MVFQLTIPGYWTGQPDDSFWVAPTTTLIFFGGGQQVPDFSAYTGQMPRQLTPREKCLDQAYNTPEGKAVQFLSPISLTPLNPNWKQNWSEWGIALFGKGGGMFGSGIGTKHRNTNSQWGAKCRFVA
jgi:hypothetical protein